MFFRRLFSGFNEVKNLFIPLPYQRFSSDFCKECSGECVEVCEEKIVFKIENGIPYLDFTQRGCIFCKKCAYICQENYGQQSVLDALLEDKIKGIAKIDTLLCLAYHQIICSSCKDICDGSIKFAGFFYPEILVTCTSCGQCVKCCPQGAISIVPLRKIRTNSKNIF